MYRTISKVLAYVLESFSLRCLFEKNRFPGDPQKHFGNSARYPPLGKNRSVRTHGGNTTNRIRNIFCFFGLFVGATSRMSLSKDRPPVRPVAPRQAHPDWMGHELVSKQMKHTTHSDWRAVAAAARSDAIQTPPSGQLPCGGAGGAVSEGQSCMFCEAEHI